MQFSSSRITPRSQAAVNSKLERKLWMYAAAATAAGAGMLTVTPADAEIVVTHVNTAISPSVAIDLNHDGIVDFNLTHWKANASIELFSYLAVCHSVYHAASHQCLSSSNKGDFANVVRGTSRGALDLPFGAPIGPGQQFGGAKGRVTMGGRNAASFSSIHDQTWYGPWVAGGAGVKNRYLGFKFKIGSQFHFGWARVTVTTTAHQGFSATLTGYAYETIPNKPIHAGATSDAPQAALESAPQAIKTQEADRQVSLGILSLGSMGLDIWRRENS